MKLIMTASPGGQQGKTSFAVALAIEAMKNGADVAVADLDVEFRSATEIFKDRQEAGIEPLFVNHEVQNAQEALNCFADEKLGIIDAPSRAGETVKYLTPRCDLVIFMTTPDKKHMDLTIRMIEDLVKAGVDTSNCLIIMSRVLTPPQFKHGKEYLLRSLEDIEKNGVRVLTNCLWEKPSITSSINDGYCMTETQYDSVNNNAKAVIHETINILYL